MSWCEEPHPEYEGVVCSLEAGHTTQMHAAEHAPHDAALRLCLWPNANLPRLTPEHRTGQDHG